jgi:hypothetical protein
VIRTTPPLPLDLAATLAGRVRWLRQEVAAIDAELGLTYPTIEIVTGVYWAHKWADGTRGYVAGRVTVSHERFVVQLNAVALVEYNDDLIRGVLAHEFLHVVQHTINVAAGHMAGAPAVSLDPGDEATYAKYRSADVVAQAPASWLSARLRRLMDAAENDHNPALRAALRAIKENARHWPSLPIESPRAEYTASKLLLNRAILARARQIESDQKSHE